MDSGEDDNNISSTYSPRREAKSGTAPWYTVPQRAIVSVEHPCIIKNIDKGLRTLGEDTQIDKLLEADKPRSISLYLRPDDLLSQPLRSTNVITNNLLIKVTVPKRTGRKRKRGSDEPYTGDEDVLTHDPSIQDEEARGSNCTASRTESAPKDAAYLVQSLRDNMNRYKVEPVGTIEQTHRFRGLPDFQLSAVEAPFMSKMRDYILPYEYDRLKEFNFDPSKGAKLNGEIIPPPSFSRLRMPLNYGYNQNPAVRTAVGISGMPVTGNTQSAPIIFTHLVTYDVEHVPTEPDPNLLLFETLDRPLQTVIEQVRVLFDQRPMWTRRALFNRLTDQKFANTIKYAVQYVGYMFRSGPWNNVIVKFGVDPRKDPKYRFYQTLMFQLKAKGKRAAISRWEDGRARYKRKSRGKQKDIESHLFNGRKVSLDGKTWQICDIIDPLLKESIYTDNIRAKCDILGDGWYHNGTLAKVKTIIKAKIKMILEGRTPSDADFISVLELPEIIDDTTRPQTILDKRQVSIQEVRWATNVRNVMNKPAPRTESGPNHVIDGRTAPQPDGNSENIAQIEAKQDLLMDGQVIDARHDHTQDENFVESYQLSESDDNEIEIESGEDSDNDDMDETEGEDEESHGQRSGDEEDESNMNGSEDEDQKTDQDGSEIEDQDD